MQQLRTWLTVGGVLAAAACSGRRAAPAGSGPPPGDATLAFAAAPAPTRARIPFAAIRVRALDGFGQPAADGTAIRLELLPPGNGGRLEGTLEAKTLAGVATFADVVVDRGGTYRLTATAAGFVPALADPVVVASAPLHLVLMIADGWGYKQIEAAGIYAGRVPFYTGFAAHAMATYDETTRLAHGGVGYDPARAWTEFSYPSLAATDSASSATAMYTGQKTFSGRIAVGVADERLRAIAEDADAQGLAVGAVTTVPVPHATPAAWLAHNVNRGNYFAIADEMWWGDPNTTGAVAVDARYGGSRGASTVAAAVVMGGGHPAFAGESYVRRAMLDKLLAESAQPGAWRVVERLAGHADGGARLLEAAATPGVERLCALFGGPGGNLEFRRADGSGASRENPTLAQMTAAALSVLQRRDVGFALLIEGGAIDYAGHANDLDLCIGEMIDFEDAVRAVVDWVETPGDAADWSNTLLIVTGDHETGYLTAGVDAFPNVPLVEVSPRTLALERVVRSTGRRASWEDTVRNGDIDAGETVYWAWHTGGHSNSLIPLYVRGAGADRFDAKVVGADPVRGGWVDNTAIFQVLGEVLAAPR